MRGYPGCHAPDEQAEKDDSSAAPTIRHIASRRTEVGINPQEHTADETRVETDSVEVTLNERELSEDDLPVEMFNNPTRHSSATAAHLKSRSCVATREAATEEFDRSDG